MQWLWQRGKGRGTFDRCEKANEKIGYVLKPFLERGESKNRYVSTFGFSANIGWKSMRHGEYGVL